MTFSFSQHSMDQRATLHPDLQLICDHLIEIHDFKIQEGHRPKELQDKALAEGRSKVKWPDGKHNKTPSEAMDLLPFVNGRFIGWDKPRQWAYFGGLALGIAETLRRMGEIEHGLRWGHDFDQDDDLLNQKFIDAPHFEILTM